ncbi:MAG: hypothetical protein V4724_35890 [Pseudomonadota bacterium]
MMGNLEIAGFGMASAGVLLAGVVSAALYGRKRSWTDALLALSAALALAAMLAGLSRPGNGAGALAIDSDAVDDKLARALLSLPGAESVVLSGHGLREAQWRDLPARALLWNEPKADLLHLDFPRTLALGRTFTLTVRRAQLPAGWRLQLLAENGQVLAESAKATAAGAAAPDQLSVQWLPPLAETLVLQARLLNAAGKTIAFGPVPLQVNDPLPLQVQGRFGAASFDARALNRLLADSNAILDWQVTLGKGIARSETARAELAEPNALFVDAAHVEGLSPAARAALLAQAGQGVPLIVLGGNATDSGLWQREFGLRLAPQPAATEKEDVRQFTFGTEQIALPPASLNPAGKPGDAWSVLAADDKRQPWLWQRAWKKGRIVWIGVSDWHRYAITSPAALGLWWQALLDRTAIGSKQKIAWRQPDPMPVAGLRTEVCAQGASASAPVLIDGLPAAAWQARADKADAVCVAFWPVQAGWQTLRSGEFTQRFYIYDKADWPAWQQALRHDATAQYAARSPQPAATAAARAPLPAWPFALVFASCMLGLWWRERR